MTHHDMVMLILSQLISISIAVTDVYGDKHGQLKSYIDSAILSIVIIPDGQCHKCNCPKQQRFEDYIYHESMRATQITNLYEK